jgi:pimeloyl-ACP methyl ester carboxylesterase
MGGFVAVVAANRHPQRFSRLVLLDGGLPLDHPTLLLRAPRGLFNQVPPLYPDDAAAAWEAQLPNLRVELVPNVNHYTILRWRPMCSTSSPR